MGIEGIVNKYGLDLNWKDEGMSVYSNDIISIRIIEPLSNEDKFEIKIEYKKIFDRWSTAFYSREFDVMDDKTLKVIEIDICKIQKSEQKALHRTHDGFTLNREYLKRKGVLMDED